MDTKTRRMGRKGVSPVIATILLIAVTVVMAGILAALRDKTDTMLSVQF